MNGKVGCDAARGEWQCRKTNPLRLRRRLDLFLIGGENVGDAVDQQTSNLIADLDNNDCVAGGRLSWRRRDRKALFARSDRG